MKITKILSASALTLALSGICLGTAKADEPVNTGVDETIDQEQDDNTNGPIEIMPYNLEASYLGVTFSGGGEYHNSFSVSNTAADYNVRYNFKNNGVNTFDYKIIRPDGSIFASGTLTSKQSKTVTLEKNCYYMPKGKYKFSIITKNGGPGAFDFAFRVLD